MSLDFGLSSLNVGNEAELDRKWAEKKRAQRLGKPVGTNDNKEKVRINPAPLHNEPQVSASQILKLTKSDRGLLREGPKKEKTKQDMEKAMARKAALLRIYENYYRRDETRPFLPKKLALSIQSSDEQISGALSQVRGALNAANAATTIRKIFPELVEMIIRGLETAGMLEAAGLEGARGAGSALARALGSPAMQTEMTEMEIEMEDWFASSWQMRLAIKTYMFVKAYSDAQKSMHKPGAVSAGAMAALGLSQPAPAPAPQPPK